MTRLSLAAGIVVLCLGPAVAQGARPDCTQAAQGEPATKPAPSADGTAPGNAGSTGWSGGLGGSHIGTAPAGSVARDFQPATAKGLDLTGGQKTNC